MKTFSRFIVEIQFEGRKYTERVEKESFVVGRSSECDIHIDSKNLSRQHAKISIVDGQIYVEDLKSTNGCFIDGEQIPAHKPTLYTADKVLTLGKHEDVILDLKADFSINKSPTTTKEIKKSLLKTFDKSPTSLEDPAPPKAERNYKEIMNQVEILKTEIIERAEKRADKILEDAKESADKLIAETEGKKEELLTDAKVAADKIIADAIEQSKNLKEQKELAELLQQIDDKKAEVERINEIIATCRENLKKLEVKNTEFLELEEKNSNLELSIKNLESKQLTLLENQKDIEARLSVSTEELEKVTTEKEKIKSYLEETESKNSEIINSLREKESEVENLTTLKNELVDDISNLSEKKKEYDELTVTFDKLQKDFDEKAEAFKNILLEIQQADQELKELNKAKDSFLAESESRNEQIQKETNNLENLKKEYDDFFEKKKALLLEIDEITSKKEASVHELSEIEKKAHALDLECGEKLKKASDEADLILAQANAKAQAEYINLVEKSKQSLAEKEESLLVHAKAQAKEIIEKANVEVANIETQAKKINDDIVGKAEVKAEKILKESQVRADELRDKAQSEYQKLIKQAETDVDQIKAKSIQFMEEKKKDFVELEKKRIRKSSELLKSELNVLLFSKLKLFLKEDGDEFMSRVKMSLESAVNSCMLNEVLENDDQMYALLDDQVLKQQTKAKNYWRYTVPGVITSIIVLYFAIPFFKETIKEKSREVASMAKQQTKQRIEKKEEEAKAALFEYFSPKKTTEFKDTYTDRVLYTDKYAELSLEKEYREDWILELQTFFVDELELSENALVPFISQEANMIRELVEQSKKINGRFIEQGINKMRDIENDFLVKLKENLNSEDDYKKIMKFQEKFFKKRVKNKY